MLETWVRILDYSTCQKNVCVRMVKQVKIGGRLGLEIKLELGLGIELGL